MSVISGMLPKVSSASAASHGKLARRSIRRIDLDDFDPVLTVTFIALLTIGLIMVASSSISVADRNFSNPFYYLQRQSVFVVLGVLAALTVFKIRLAQWDKIPQLRCPGTPLMVIMPISRLTRRGGLMLHSRLTKKASA